MKRFLPVLLIAAGVAACATTPHMSDADKLALYRAHAGAPVSSLRYLGHIDGWTPLGDSAVALWTRPNEAWLLELSGTCQGLQYTPVIGVTSTMSRVSAGFDKVLVRDPGAINIPCIINQIRPLDVKAIKHAEKSAREQIQSDQAPAPQAQPSGT